MIEDQQSMKQSVPKGERPIAVFDSGVGGLPYLAWMKQHLPGESFVYLADRENFPYGEKDEDRLRSIVLDTVGRFIDARDPEVMVIACNTASVVALADLRDRFQVPFVGVVPAVKPAAALSETGAIGILATRRTVEDPYTDGLVDSFARNCRVYRYAGVEIVDLVENRLFTAAEEEKRRVLQPAVDYFRERRVDTVVVACTHFIFVQQELEEMLGPGVRVIDSREGVGRQVIHILREAGLIKDSKASDSSAGTHPSDTAGMKSNKDYFFISECRNEKRYRRFAETYGLNWGGVL